VCLRLLYFVVVIDVEKKVKAASELYRDLEPYLNCGGWGFLEDLARMYLVGIRLCNAGLRRWRHQEHELDLD
jgi:hypothetical protein